MLAQIRGCLMWFLLRHLCHTSSFLCLWLLAINIDPLKTRQTRASAQTSMGFMFHFVRGFYTMACIWCEADESRVR